MKVKVKEINIWTVEIDDNLSDEEIKNEIQNRVIFRKRCSLSDTKLVVIKSKESEK